MCIHWRASASPQWLKTWHFSILLSSGRDGFAAFIQIPCPSNTKLDGASLMGEKERGLRGGITLSRSFNS